MTTVEKGELIAEFLAKRGSAMTNQWSFKIEVYPHSTGQGHEVDTEACGGRYFERTVTAEDARMAMILADVFADGLARNPRVWMANVIELRAV